MEKAYWLSGKRTSPKMAPNADSSEVRLAHDHLAGRYRLKAMSAETLAIDFADGLPPPILSKPQKRHYKCAGND